MITTLQEPKRACVRACIFVACVCVHIRGSPEELHHNKQTQPAHLSIGQQPILVSTEYNLNQAFNNFPDAACMQVCHAPFTARQQRFAHRCLAHNILALLMQVLQ